MLHHDLLEQARYLAFREPKKPRQASLRRAVSAAYYALFHMLLHETTMRLFPNSPPQLRHRAKRAIAHGPAKDACKRFASGGGIQGLTALPVETELRKIAKAFAELQEARHKADYDLSETFDRVQVDAYIYQVEDAMTDWKKVKNAPNANVFLSALLINERWNK
jgi:hypothetical protein